MPRGLKLSGATEVYFDPAQLFSDGEPSVMVVVGDSEDVLAFLGRIPKEVSYSGTKAVPVKTVYVGNLKSHADLAESFCRRARLQGHAMVVGIVDTNQSALKIYEPLASMTVTV